MFHNAMFPRQPFISNTKAGQTFRIIYKSTKQYRTNPCVLVALNCAPHCGIARHTIPENVSMKWFMKEQVVVVCAALVATCCPSQPETGQES